MQTRKVLEMGGGTMLISLPKSWARRNRIARGASVSVEEISPRRLLVRPIEAGPRESREVLVEYPRENLAYVINDVTGAYLIGGDLIKVEGRQVISREDRERLKGVIRRLVGLEIIDEDSKSMTLQFLPEPSSLDPGRIVRRMANLTEGMLRDAREGIGAGDAKVLSLVGERDDEVDRLYFLLVRAIRSATIDPEMAERYGLAPIECLDYRVLASFMEGLGDTIAEFSKSALEERSGEKASREIVMALKTLEEMEELAIRSFLSRSTGQGRRAYVEMEEMQKKVSDSSLKMAQTEGIPTRVMVDLLGHVERMAKILVDIADLALPTYQFKGGPGADAD